VVRLAADHRRMKKETSPAWVKYRTSSTRVTRARRSGRRPVPRPWVDGQLGDQAGQRTRGDELLVHGSTGSSLSSSGSKFGMIVSVRQNQFEMLSGIPIESQMTLKRQRARDWGQENSLARGPQVVHESRSPSGARCLRTLTPSRDERREARSPQACVRGLSG